MKGFTQLAAEHQGHVLDNLFSRQEKAVKGCPFCENSGLLDKILEGVEES